MTREERMAKLLRKRNALEDFDVLDLDLKTLQESLLADQHCSENRFMRT